MYVVTKKIIPNIIIAPAMNALEFKLTKFASSIYGGETEYQGPPTEYNNKLWKDLYSRKPCRLFDTENTDWLVRKQIWTLTSPKKKPGSYQTKRHQKLNMKAADI